MLANGGGTTTIGEPPVHRANASDVRVRGNSNALGVDLNGDGDLLDTVRFYTPNTTNTNRYGATSVADLGHQRRRSACASPYTYDRAQHRQTAQWGPMDFDDGQPKTCSQAAKAIASYAADGDIIRGRDRYSVAELQPVRARVPRLSSSTTS